MPQDELEFMPVLRRPAGTPLYERDPILNGMATFMIVFGVLAVGFLGAIGIYAALTDDKQTQQMTHQEMCEQKLHGVYERKSQPKAQHDNICHIGDFPMNMGGLVLPYK